jgi:hypothetical protein
MARIRGFVGLVKSEREPFYHGFVRGPGKNRRVSLRAFPSRIALLGGMATVLACVPTGSAPPYDAGPSPSATSTFKPSINIMTAPFEDNFDRPDAGEALALPGDASSGPANLDAALDPRKNADARTAAALNEAGGDALLSNPNDKTDGGATALAGDGGSFTVDGGRPSNLGPNWSAVRTNAWKIENGRLCGENAHNHGVWLNRTLPVNARIEFDAYALTDEGDLKAEVWGDGHSYATGTSYTNATSYLAILGGWKNTIHALARLNEHGSDRKDIKVDKDSDDPRQRAVVRGQLYQFKIERTDSKTVRFSVNGIEYLSWADPSPLAGQGHDHLGFNEWEAKVCFDNVKVTPL